MISTFLDPLPLIAILLGGVWCVRPAVVQAGRAAERMAERVHEAEPFLERGRAHRRRHEHVRTGDLIVAGTPAGIGPLEAGDTVTIKVEGVGELTNSVRRTGR